MNAERFVSKDGLRAEKNEMARALCLLYDK